MRLDNQLKQKYPKESAGRIMIENVPVALPEMRILDVKEILLREIKNLETINYIYVVDKDKRLIGVFSIKEIFRAPGETKVEELIGGKIIKVRPNTDQERVAILALRHNLKAIPVVNKEGVFLGAVPSDVILNILHSENVEDLFREAGISKTELPFIETEKVSSKILVKARIPWLFFGLFGGMMAAKIVELFESSLGKHFVLIAFIPLMVYMADAVGAQTQTLFIRSLAVNNDFNFKKYFLKEIKVSFLIALILGVVLFFFSFFFFNSFAVGIILGASLFLTVISAGVIGVIIPWGLKIFKKDPAIGSGPFATIIRDILSLVIYFSVSSLFFQFF